MMLSALALLNKYGRPFPLTEDWLCVPPLTGNEPNIAQWLWAQNNEHRAPFAKLLLLSLLKLSHGDFRAGMMFNIVSLGILSGAMILVARHLRNGRTSIVDAFFPLVLLHLGHAENLFWSWQVTQVVPTVLAFVTLLVLVTSDSLVTPVAALVAGTSVLLLSLNGINGVIYAPILAIWLGYRGLLHWLTNARTQGVYWTGSFLSICAALALGLSGLYFVGYQRPSWAPSPTDLGAWLEATFKFLAMGFGPIATGSWILSVTATIALLTPSAILVVWAALRHRGNERQRALGILLFAGTIVVFALGIGWGRAGAITIFRGWPLRYCLLAAVALCATFYIWQLYGPVAVRKAVHGALFGLMLVLLPLNTTRGLYWLDLYPPNDKRLLADLSSGLPPLTLAEQYKKHLFHNISIDQLATYMRMLRDAGYTPFAQMIADPIKAEITMPPVASPRVPPDVSLARNLTTASMVTQEIRYRMLEAAEVAFVWGLNGWRVAPENLRPFGTELTNNVLHTPMTHIGDIFTVTLSLPAGVVLDYCFLITQKRGAFRITWPLCEGNFRATPSRDNVVEVHSKISLSMVTQELRYIMPEAKEVHLVWGLNGWHLAPEELRPAGTELRSTGTETEPKAMHTPMIQDGDAFIVRISVPVGTPINYGFLIMKARGLFDINYPIWDGEYQAKPSQDNIAETRTTLRLINDVSDVLKKRRYFLVGIASFFSVWFLIFLALSLAERRVARSV